MLFAAIIIGIICGIFWGIDGFEIGLVGSFALMALFAMLVEALHMLAEDRERKELARHGLKKIEVTRHIHHRYDGSVFSPYDNDEERTEEIIVPMDRDEK